METSRLWGARLGRAHSWSDSATNNLAAEIFSRLAGAGKNSTATFQKKFGAKAASEWSSLAQEQDGEMFLQGLLLFGRRLEERGQVALAAEVYNAILQARPPLPPFGHPLPPGERGNQEGHRQNVPSLLRGESPTRHSRFGDGAGQGEGKALAFAGIRERAQEELDALLGRGSFGLRAEILGRDLFHMASDYRILLSMAAGTGLYQVGKNIAWARLLAHPVASPFTRGVGARFTAAMTGLSLEAPTFSLLHRSLLALSGEPVNWGPKSLRDDLAKAALALSVMKFSGWVGQKMVRSNSLVPAIGMRGVTFVPPGLTFFGLLGVNQLEVGLGLRSQADGATMVSDTLGSWIAMALGANFTARVLGPGWASLNRELQVRGETFAESRPVFRPLFQGLPAPARPSAVSGSGRVHRPMGMSGPLAILSASTPLERLVRWLGGILPGGGGQTETLPTTSASPGSSSPQGEDARLQMVFKKYPKLKKAMEKASFSPAKKLALLNLVIAQAEADFPEALEHLGGAIRAMDEADFSYEWIFSILENLGEEEGSYPKKILHIPGAISAVRKVKATDEEKFQFIVDMAKKSGRNADRVFANLLSPVKALYGNGWTLTLIREMLGGIVEEAGDQIGTVLASFPDAFEATVHEIWLVKGKIQFYRLLAHPAEDDFTMEWRWKEGFPLAMAEMESGRWDTDDRFEVMMKMMQKTRPHFDRSLEYFPGAAYAFRQQDWHPRLSGDLFRDVIDASGDQASRVFKWSPGLTLILEEKGLAETTQKEIIVDIARQAPRLNDLALQGFVAALLRGPKLNDEKN